MLKIIIGTTVFTAMLFQNKTSEAFKAMLPITIKMTELNNNEKFVYLPTTLPTNESAVGDIKPGDIMLFGDACLVLFYKGFKTSFSYTKIGQITDTSKLMEALGNGNVTVTFEWVENRE